MAPRRSRSSIYSSPPSRFEPPSLKLWLNCWCSSGEWGYKTKITFVEEESERNFIGDKSTLGWNQIWTRNGEIWNNTWLNFTINSWWMGPYTPYYTTHTLISPMESPRSNYQSAASQHSISPRIQLRRECRNREFLLLNKEQLNQDNTSGTKGHHTDLRALNVRMKLTGVKDIYVTWSTIR